MRLSPKQIQNLRRSKELETNKLVNLQSIQGKIGTNLSTVSPTDLPTGADKINQLILEQSAKLQTLATEQIANITSEFGIININASNPTIQVPSAKLPPGDLKLPKIPEGVSSATPELTITPVEINIQELDTALTVVQEQFVEQLKPLNYDNIGEEEKRQVILTLTPVALQLASELFNAKPPFCPTNNRLQQILKKYNNLIDALETTATVLNYTSTSLNIVTQVLNGTITAKVALELAKTTVNQVLKAAPVAPGAVASAIIDVEDAIKVLTYEADGSSKLSKKKKQLETGTFYISLASIIVDGIITILKIITPALKQCGLEPKELGPEITKFIEEAETKKSTNTEQSYKGFAFEIVDVKLPNDPTVTRKIAQALNTEGIVALKTEPSFTQNPKVLIEELKLIIDRDNLKAY